MKARLQQRLEGLRGELKAGQEMMAELQARQAALRETLLRISGAIQVLEEELEAAAPPRDGVWIDEMSLADGGEEPETEVPR